MDFSNRDNRPTAQNAGGQPTTQPQQTMPAHDQLKPVSKKRFGGHNSGSMFSKLGSVVVIIGVALLAAAVVATLVFNDGSKKNLESAVINGERYQAVFLDSQDGQVYFGKLAVYNEDLYLLNDIFYVRVENPIQPQGTEPQQPNISLAKLGNELHGPEDVMFIARDKVLYWENLKDDGQVVTAIKNFKANGSQVPAQPESNESGASGNESDDEQTTDSDDESPTTTGDDTSN